MENFHPSGIATLGRPAPHLTDRLLVEEYYHAY